jgi:effector-binding domain-containing protein
MKKRTWILIVCLILVVTSFFLWAPITFSIKREIIIRAPIYNVAGKLTDLRNWKQWYPALKTTDSSSFIHSRSTTQINSFLQAGDHVYTILNSSPAYILIRDEKKNGNKEYHSLYTFPDSLGSATRVIWIKSVSPFIWLRDKFHSDENMRIGLTSLKKSLEDPSEFYGFPIAIGPVTDTIVATKTAIANEADKISTLHRLYSEIYQYLQKNNITAGNIRIANFSIGSPGQLKISAGIPVTKKGPEENGIAYLQMPRGGKMLVGKYEGPYSGLNKLYTAMEKYVTDKQLHKVALQYERYLTDPSSANDSLHMRIEIFYPIY